MPIQRPPERVGPLDPARVGADDLPLDAEDAPLEGVRVREGALLEAPLDALLEPEDGELQEWSSSSSSLLLLLLLE